MNTAKSSSSTKSRRGAGIALLVGAVALIASACSSGYGRTARAAGTGTTGPGASGQPAKTSAVTITVGSSSLGPIGVDAAGHTLYHFDKDKPGSGSSACNGACATAWPPALVTGQPTAGSGLTGTLGAITRADGTRQLTLDGHPLYRFSGDQNPGDTTGDGFGGIWHVVHASAQATTSTTSPAVSSGY